MASRSALLILIAFFPAAAPAASDGGFGAIGSSGVHGPNAHCVFCHGGALPPVVELTGPTLVPAGGQGEYQLTIRGGAAVVGGFSAEVREVAAPNARDATLLPSAGAQQNPQNPAEVLHSAPRPFGNGEVSFAFTLVAPPRPGLLKLFAAGNSCNGDGTNNGDASAATSLEVEVYKPAEPNPPAGEPDAGAVDPVTPSAPDPSAPDGGCSSMPGPPVALALLFLGALARARRQPAGAEAGG